MVRFHSNTIAAVAVAATAATRTTFDVVNGTPNLNHALVRDVLPPQSTKCSTATTTTTFEFDFNNVNASASNWNPLHKDQEHLVFLAEISNGLDPNTHDNGWKLRVGQAGVIYSLLGKFGEALPPQGGVHSPWNDEVWQQTMTHRPLNHDSSGGLYMIHQAGVYLFDDALSGIYPSPYVLSGDKDDATTNDPTATISCDNNSCAFVSWGQQAHIPTPHPSNALYYTRVADCGNGAIEYTMVTHNMKVSPTVTSDFYDLFTTPWMGVRGETFRDVLSTAGRTIEEGSALVKPKPIFQTNGRPNMEDTLGYIVFTQGIKDDEVLPQFEIPCTDPTNPFKSVDCKNDGTDLQAVLKAGKTNFCVESKAHTAIYGRAVIRCTLEQTDEAKFGDLYGDILVSKAGDTSSDDKLHMRGILYYALRGQFLFFVSRNFPDDMDWLNTKFTTGDQLVMEHTDIGYTYEENHALAAVYGTYHTMNRPTYMVNAGTYPTEDYLDGDWASSYIIFGQGASITRDVIVYGACHRGMLLEGETYRERSYFVIDKLSNIDIKAQEYTTENYRDIFKQDSPDMGTGQKITLFKYTASDTTFGGCLSDTENCGQDTAEIICNGWTTPKDISYMPLFSMSCGTTHYVGTDRYYFTPTDANHGYLRNYICDGEANTDIKPTYHLLGYFPYGTCDALQGTKFDQTLCTSTGGDTSPVAAPVAAEAPVEPVPAPVAAPSVEAPVEPVPAPVAEAPVEAPVEPPVEAPVEPVSAPVESPVEAPVEPVAAPVEPPVEAPTVATTPTTVAASPVITEGEYDCTSDPFMYLFELDLETDHLGNDTTWEVIDIMNGQSVMYSGGPYTNISNQGYKYGKCLPKLSCYKFVIHDLSSDGITGEGNGVIVKWNHIEEMNTIDQPATNNLQFSHDGVDFGMSCAPTGGALMSTPYYSDISNGVYGIMFDIKSKKDIVFRRFHALHLASSSSTTPVDYKVYTKNGSYKGYEHLPDSWSLVHHETLTSSSGLNTWTYASNFASPVTALDGTTQAFYIALDQKLLLVGDGQTLGLTHGDSYQTYGDFDVLVGDVFDTTPSDGAFTASDNPITPTTPAMFSGRFTYGTARINY